MIILDDFNEFLRGNSLWIALGFLALVVVVFLLVLIISLHNNKKKKMTVSNIDFNEFVSALGNKDNIISSEVKGSRLNVILKNYDIVDEEKLQSLGVASIIKMSNRIILVIDQNIEKYFKAIN
jgi:phosphotransferase system IIB component